MFDHGYFQAIRRLGCDAQVHSFVLQEQVAVLVMRHIALRELTERLDQCQPQEWQ